MQHHHILLSILTLMHLQLITHPTYLSSFLRAAHTCKASGDTKLNALLAPAATSIPQRPKKQSRFMTLGRNKQKKAAELPTHIINPISTQEIFDDYIASLSFAIGCYERSSPVTAMYIRSHITGIFASLTRLFPSVDLFSPDIIYEPGYKEILTACKDAIHEPILPELIINAIAQHHAKAESALTHTVNRALHAKISKKLQMHMQVLMHMYAHNRTEPYQKIMFYAYTKRAWHLLERIPRAQSKIFAHPELSRSWQSIHASQPPLKPVVEEVHRQQHTKNILYASARTQKNNEFSAKLMHNQCAHLRNLLHIHHAYMQSPIDRLILEKIIRDEIASTHRNLSHATRNRVYVALCAAYKKQHIPLSQTLTQLHDLLIAAPKQALKALAVLTDIYNDRLVPPKHIRLITKPLKYIEKILHEDQASALRSLQTMLYTDPTIYAVTYYIKRAETRAINNAQKAKQLYLIAAENSIASSPDTQRYLSASADHLYTRLLQLHEQQTHFTHAEYLQLAALANHIQATLPLMIAVKIEAARFQTFIQDMLAQKFLDEPL